MKRFLSILVSAALCAGVMSAPVMASSDSSSYTFDVSNGITGLKTQGVEVVDNNNRWSFSNTSDELILTNATTTTGKEHLKFYKPDIADGDIYKISFSVKQDLDEGSARYDVVNLLGGMFAKNASGEDAKVVWAPINGSSGGVTFYQSDYTRYADKQKGEYNFTNGEWMSVEYTVNTVKDTVSISINDKSLVLWGTLSFDVSDISYLDFYNDGWGNGTGTLTFKDITFTSEKEASSYTYDFSKGVDALTKQGAQVKNSGHWSFSNTSDELILTSTTESAGNDYLKFYLPELTTADIYKINYSAKIDLDSDTVRKDIVNIFGGLFATTSDSDLEIVWSPISSGDGGVSFYQYDGYKSYEDGQAVGYTLSDGTWKNFEYVVNTKNNTISISVNGNSLITNGTIRDDITGISYLSFYNKSWKQGKGTITFKNVTFTAVENPVSYTYDMSGGIEGVKSQGATVDNDTNGNWSFTNTTDELILKSEGKIGRESLKFYIPTLKEADAYKVRFQAKLDIYESSTRRDIVNAFGALTATTASGNVQITWPTINSGNGNIGFYKADGYSNYGSVPGYGTTSGKWVTIEYKVDTANDTLSIIADGNVLLDNVATDAGVTGVSYVEFNNQAWSTGIGTLTIKNLSVGPWKEDLVTNVTVNGAEAQALSSYAGKSADIEVVVENNALESIAPTYVFAAVYNGDDLTDVKFAKADEIEAGESNTTSVSIDVPSDTSNCKLAVFVWTVDSFSPITNATVIK